MRWLIGLARKRDFLSIGVILGEIAFLTDIICLYLELGGVHEHPICFGPSGIKASFCLGIPALAMLVFGKRGVLESAHENQSWVRSVLILRWAVVFYWASQLIMAMVAFAIAIYIMRS